MSAATTKTRADEYDDVCIGCRTAEANWPGREGVSWNARRGKWRAQIQVDGKKQHLGYFKSKLEAGVAVVNARHPHAEARAELHVRLGLEAMGVEHADLDSMQAIDVFFEALIPLVFDELGLELADLVPRPGGLGSKLADLNLLLRDSEGQS